MSEKRKPEIVIVAQSYGKRHRLELYPVNLWPADFWKEPFKGGYRLRMNGRWVASTWTITEIMRQLRMVLTARRRRR
jgi:hypothetical protein